MPVIDLGFRPRKWQHDVLSKLKRFSITVVHRGAGKTVLAVMKLIDSALRFTKDGNFAYIAPELKQAKDIIWNLLKSYSRQIPGTEINESETWVRFSNGSRIRLYGADNIDSLRGRHFDGVVVDEVAQMALDFWGLILLPALEARKGWALFIGTPNGLNLLHELYQTGLQDPASWFATLFNVYQTGVYTEDEILAIQKRLTPRQFRQEMLCDFQASSDDTLVSVDAAMEAWKRVLTPLHYEHAPIIMGVDVAWAGGDRCVIQIRQGLKHHFQKAIQGLPEKSFSGLVAAEWQRWGVDACFIDITGGYGGEVLSRVRDAGFNAIGIKFSEGAFDPKFMNIRAEMWFKMADWIKDGASIIRDELLVKEITMPTYSNDNASNRLKLESKDDVKERLRMSPDLADALALTFAQPVRARREDALERVKMQRQGLQGWDYNPVERMKNDRDLFAS